MGNNQQIKALRVTNWSQFFENSNSRKVNNATYVCVPNKHDGKGFARVAIHQQSCRVFTGWMLILQVASKMPQRGLLADEDGALDVDDLAVMTRFDVATFNIAIEALTNPKIGWLEWVDVPNELNLSGRNTDKIQVNRDDVPDHPDTLGQNRTEQKGTEQNIPPQSPKGEKIDDAVIESIYQEYPKKVGKPKALQAIRKALKQIDAGELLEQVKRYAVARRGQDPQFTPHPATWFNQCRFNDDPVTWSSSNDAPAKQAQSGLDEEGPEGWSEAYRQTIGNPPSVWALVPPDEKQQIQKHLNGKSK